MVSKIKGVDRYRLLAIAVIVIFLTIVYIESRAEKPAHGMEIVGMTCSLFKYPKQSDMTSHRSSLRIRELLHFLPSGSVGEKASSSR